MKYTLLLFVILEVICLDNDDDDDPVRTAVINAVRATFLDLAKEQPDNYHPKDVELIRQSKWWVERFVIISKTEDRALTRLTNTMKWRKQFAISDLNDQYFPIEIHKIGFAALLCQDKQNRPVVFVRGKLYRRSDLDHLMKQYMVYQFERADYNTTNQGWAVVLDASKLNILKIDFEIFEFFVEVLNSHYPLAIKYVLVVNMPRTMNWLSRIMIRLMNLETRSMVKFIKQKKLTNYIYDIYIPKHLGGKYEYENREVFAETWKPLHESDHLNLTDKQIDNFRNKFSSELQGLDFMPKRQFFGFIRSKLGR